MSRLAPGRSFSAGERWRGRCPGLSRADEEEEEESARTDDAEGK